VNHFTSASNQIIIMLFFYIYFCQISLLQTVNLR